MANNLSLSRMVHLPLKWTVHLTTCTCVVGLAVTVSLEDEQTLTPIWISMQIIILSRSQVANHFGWRKMTRRMNDKLVNYIAVLTQSLPHFASLVLGICPLNRIVMLGV